MKVLKKKKMLFLLILILFIFINNTTIFTTSNKQPALLAHRGMAQTFDMKGVAEDSCTAEKIHIPEHGFLENTIPSMEAAFNAGADIVELDVHPTSDGEFVVFHDWTLDCRTEGHGDTREHSLKELTALDVGYGYTADNGKTYPFRGKGVGMMPTLDEVLRKFGGKQLMIHVKSNDSEEGTLLADYLNNYPAETLKHLSIYGGDEPIAVLKEKMPGTRVMSKDTLKSCLLPYIAIGWTGYVPDSCKNTNLQIPEKIGPWLWGWPEKFVDRMEQKGTNTVIVGGNGSGFSSGFDTEADLGRLPDDYQGVIWTNKIEKIAPIIKELK